MRPVNSSRHAKHGNNTLIVQVSDYLTLGEARKPCTTLCEHFGYCSRPQVKNAVPGGCCQWPHNTPVYREAP